MNNIKTKEIIKRNVKISRGKSKRLGGQHAGIEKLPIIIESKELSLKIEFQYFRSDFKNKEFAMLLFDLACDELNS